MVPFGRDEDLRLVLQAAERLRVDYPVSVALKWGAQWAVGLLVASMRGIGPRRRLSEKLALPGADSILQ
jgi:hypothetical protein